MHIEHGHYQQPYSTCAVHIAGTIFQEIRISNFKFCEINESKIIFHNFQKIEFDNKFNTA